MKRLYAALVLGTGFWGFSFVFVKAGVGSHQIGGFLAWRFGVAALVLALLFPQARRLHGPLLGEGLMLGLLMFGGTVAQSLALPLTPAANVAFIAGLTVLFVPLAKGLWRRQWPTLPLWVAAGLALLGLGLLVLRPGLRFNAGDLWALLSAGIFSVYVLGLERFAPRRDALALTLAQLGTAACAGLVWALMSGESLQPPASGDFWQALVFTSLLSTAYMYSVQAYAQRHLSAEKIALIFLLEPLFAALGAAWLLKEPFTLTMMLGAALMLLAMGLAEWPGAARSENRSLAGADCSR
ncbi:MAG: DMT family transporter [Candidatus Sericytochromatia bacterium]